MLLIQYMSNAEAPKCNNSSKLTHSLIFSRSLYRCGSTSQTCTRIFEMDTTSSLCWRCCLELRWWGNTNGVTTHTQACPQNQFQNHFTGSLHFCTCLILMSLRGLMGPTTWHLNSLLECMISWLFGQGYLCCPVTWLEHPLPVNALTVSQSGMTAQIQSAETSCTVQWLMISASLFFFSLKTDCRNHNAVRSLGRWMA